MAEARGACSGAVVARLQAAVEEFAPDNPQRDDITAVVCKVGACP